MAKTDMISTRKMLYSILSGVMLTASFPPARLEWMVWFALVPLLKALEGERGFNAFRLGFFAGLAHYLTLIYWIVVVLDSYGGLNFVMSLSILILLCVYLSLYTGIFSLLVSHLDGSRFRLFMIAFVWVSLEYIRAKLLTGFPWCLLGYSQFRHLTLIQVADLTGVYGLSFLILLFNALIYLVIFDHGSKGGRKILRYEIPVVLLILFLGLAYGHNRLSDDTGRKKKKNSVSVAIIQGNVDQSVKWDPRYKDETVELYHRLTLTTRDLGPDLVVWPETSLPFFFQDRSEYRDRVLEIARDSGAGFIVGSPAYKREIEKTKYYNRTYLISPKGELNDYYDKTHLVPFGEYVPFKKYLPFIHRLVQAAGDFAPGQKIQPLRLTEFSAGVLICFEAIFPELARAQVKNGAEILVNLTNDAWFGMTSAPYQHLCMSIFRAVENRRPLIRAANTGFSAFINPDGEILSRSSLFEEEVLGHKLELGDHGLTFYSRYGDLFIYVILVMGLIQYFFILCYHRNRTRKK
ncbi:MAG: apolipoprotein N-acyltransferase [Deltaproteobacteria bacterium]|nr:apolipoprotein N-acyltransferase [Deltaproteobacteria bacterium]